MGYICNQFTCSHVNGHTEDVKNFVTPYDKRIQALAKELNYDPEQMFLFARDIPYEIDTRGDLWFKPTETLDRGVADCLDKSVLLNSLLLNANVESWTALVYLPQNGEYHAYVEAMVNGKIERLETTCPNCSFGVVPDGDVTRLLDFNDVGIIRNYEN